MSKHVSPSTGGLAVRALDVDTWPAFAPAGEEAALGGALADIRVRGGGRVEGYPEETDDRVVSGSFLHTGPMTALESHGFTRTRQISPHRWVVTRMVEPARESRSVTELAR